MHEVTASKHVKSKGGSAGRLRGVSFSESPAVCTLLHWRYLLVEYLHWVRSVQLLC
jgi:hypothetical protein